MKTPAFLLLPAFVLLAHFLSAQDCDLLRYRQLLREANEAAFGQKPDYQLAVNKLLSAKTCQPDSESVVNVKLLKVFDEVNRQRELAVKNEREAKKQTGIAKSEREKAEAEARRIYANDLVFKSQTSLRDGDRNTAFRLAEFAYRYVDTDNPSVLQAMMDALYYNDNPEHTPLSRPCNIEGHNDEVNCVAFSPDGKWLATASSDNTAKIWDLNSRKALKTLKGHNSSVNSVAFSPDSKWLATASLDNTAKIWDLKSAKVLMTLESNNKSVWSVAFSPDGKWLATGASDNTAKIWDLQIPTASGLISEPLMTLEGHKGYVYDVAFSPDGKWLATGSFDKTAKIWDLNSAKVLMTLGDYFSEISSVTFSSDGKWLATKFGNTAKIWDLNSGNALMTLEGHNSSLSSLAFSPDGKLLATGSYDNTAKIWDLNSGNALMTFKGHISTVKSVAFSPDGKQLATGSFDKTAKIWDLQSDRALVTLKDSNGRVWSVAFSPDGKLLATGSAYNTATIWDVKSGETLMTLKGHYDPVTCVAFSPDGKWLATGSSDNIAKIWDLHNGQVLMTLEGHYNEISSVVFSPDGKWLATGSFDSTAKIWDLKSGKAAMTLEGHNGWVKSLAFSPDGKWLATGTEFGDNKAQIWDLHSAKVRMTLEGHSFWITNVAFSPDGNWLATASYDKTVKIWDLQSAKALMTLEGHEAIVTSLAFSPDGKWLATGAEDLTAKIWDLNNAKAFITLKSYDDKVNSVAFSPDGTLLATGSADGTAKIWDLQPDSLIRNWQRQPQVGLLLPQLQQYNLETLLDQHPNNEVRLIATKEVWQITAFADLAANQASGIGILASVEPLYARAERLYSAVLFANEPLIAQKYTGLLWQWAAIYRAKGEVVRASELEARAFQVSMNSVIGYELRQYANLYYQKEQWSQAAQLYEKAERLEHSPESLTALFYIAEKTGQPFDFQRLLALENAKELEQYAYHFNQKEQWSQATQLYEKAERLEHSPESLIRLYEIAEKTSQPVDFQGFLVSNEADELRQYAGYFTKKAETFEESRKKIPCYQNALLLLEKQLTLDTTASLREVMANEYVRLAYHQLFLPDGIAAEASLHRAHELDSSNKYIHANLAPALLLQDRYDEAKAEYLQWAPKDFDYQFFYGHYFLNSFKAFRAAGIILPHMDEIEALIKAL